jgi:hypothetical protein
MFTTDDVAWTALGLSVLLFLVVVTYALVNTCVFCLERRKSHHVIRHVIVSPQQQ